MIILITLVINKYFNLLGSQTNWVIQIYYKIVCKEWFLHVILSTIFIANFSKNYFNFPLKIYVSRKNSKI